MSDLITSDSGIQPFDPNSHSMATVQASFTHPQKQHLRGGWGVWGVGQSTCIPEGGFLELVGGDGLVVVSFL